MAGQIVEPVFTYVDEDGNEIDYDEREWFAYEAVQDAETMAVTTYCRPLTQAERNSWALDDMGSAEADNTAALAELAERIEEQDAALVELAALVAAGGDS